MHSKIMCCLPKAHIQLASAGVHVAPQNTALPCGRLHALMAVWYAMPADHAMILEATRLLECMHTPRVRSLERTMHHLLAIHACSALLSQADVIDGTSSWTCVHAAQMSVLAGGLYDMSISHAQRVRQPLV